MEKYESIEPGGSNHSGIMHMLYRETGTDRTVAARKISTKGWKEGVPGIIARRLPFLKEMEHENVARLFDVVHRENEDDLHMIFEYPGITLAELMKEFPEMMKDPSVIKRLLHQILQGLSCYHSMKLAHGCLSPQNLLYNPTSNILKIAELVTPYNPSYRAPELLFGSKEYFLPVDIWSVGCIFAEMVNNKPLFTGLTDFPETISIFKVMGTPSEENWPGALTKYKFLRIYYPTKKDPALELAPKVSDLEPTGIDLLLKMLVLNPTGRITVAEALKHPYFS